MSFSPAFTSSESLSSNNLITFVDSSVGSDAAITSRRIYVLLDDGTYLVPTGTTTDYIVWAYADTSIVVDLLTKSTAANVTIDWLDINGTVLYTLTTLMEWNLYDYVFLYGQLSAQTSKPNIVNDTNYQSNIFQMMVNLFNAETCVTYMDDVYSAQAALDRNFYLIQNQAKFF